MALRTLEIYVPAELEGRIKTPLQDRQIIGVWYQPLLDNMLMIKILCTAEEAEALIELFEAQYETVDEFRIVLQATEATIPRPEPEKKEPETQQQAETPAKWKNKRISIEELYADLTDMAQLDRTFVAMVVLSAIVATIGILKNNVAIIIGAMVIAPFLGPSMSLSLATNLADMNLAKQAIKTTLAGIVFALAFAIPLGYMIDIDPAIPELLARTRIDHADLVLAIASGAAGALALTTGLSTTLIGVMVAVALLPPLVTFGLLAGSGNTELCMGAALVFIANLICINLAGVITFLVKGLQPHVWWEAAKARRYSTRAILVWTALFAALVYIVYLSSYQ